MSCFSKMFRGCCGGDKEEDEEQSAPLATNASASSLNMVVDGGPNDGIDGADSTTMIMMASSTQYNSPGNSRGNNNSNNNDGNGPGNGSMTSPRKKRGVSFAPEGFIVPPSPEIKNCEIVSPRTRARSIIKSKSFSPEESVILRDDML
eukprot:GILI01032902.1.p2 GENE.GILI01032902.1~~GILI01032902.1.p2  ORF type:complete len:148 (-),score=22.73 GILI01032902.1:147-590(-)